MNVSMMQRPLSVATALWILLAAGTARAGEVCTTTPGTATQPSSASGGTEAVACGIGNDASGTASNAFGRNNRASGTISSAFGRSNTASGERSNAIGYNNLAAGEDSTAVGVASQAIGDNSSAVGFDNVALGVSSNAFGLRNFAVGPGTSSMGIGNVAASFGSNAFGLGNVVAGDASSGFGTGARIGTVQLDANGKPVLDVNGNPILLASADNAIAIGASFVAPTTIAGGAHNAIAIGQAATIAEDAQDAIAIGHGAQAQAVGALALGAGSVADRANTIAVGAAGAERQIVNVAAGTQGTDAVNLSQLQATLTTANAYTDTAVATGGTATNAYTDNREAAIRGDMTTSDVQTLSSANAYTDTRFSQVASIADDFNAFRSDVDQRLQHQDERIDRAGALGAAMVGMVASAAAVESGQTRIGVAAGSYGGKQALSLGVQRRIGGRAAITVGGAFSGSERSGTVGVGFGF